jgi:hypothetical protein
MMYKLEVTQHGLVVTNVAEDEVVMVVDPVEFVQKVEQLRLRKTGDGMPKSEFVYHQVSPVRYARR